MRASQTYLLPWKILGLGFKDFFTGTETSDFSEEELTYLVLDLCFLFNFIFLNIFISFSEQKIYTQPAQVRGNVLNKNINTHGYGAN